MIYLDGLMPAAEQGWAVLLDLCAADQDSVLLVGGQLMYLLATEHGSTLPRATDDVDVVVDVRTRRKGTEWLASWLRDRGFELDGVSPDGVGHRFVRAADPGPGTVVFDVLATEGLGPRTSLFTVRPARTLQTPGSVQAFARAQLVDVTVSGLLGGAPRTGVVRRPNLLGALVAKAAATTIPVRGNPGRDWQDAALLLSLMPDPVACAAECENKDRQRLRRLQPLEDPSHEGWATLGDEDYRRGTVALSLLLG